MPFPRPASIFITMALAGTAILAALLGHARWQQGTDRQQLARLAQLATRLELTDLALFTEARYTRHPSQADIHAPFQDHPAALEHFPSGSFVPPPGVRP